MYRVTAYWILSVCVAIVCVSSERGGGGELSTLSAAPAPIANERVLALVNSIGMRLIYVAPGSCLTGVLCHDERAGVDDCDMIFESLKSEWFRDRISIDVGFYLGAHEVTQSQYAEVMGENPSHYSANGAGGDQISGINTAMFPVEMVRYYEAVEFCNKLSSRVSEKRAGRIYRLPTAAEWEYAAITATRHFSAKRSFPAAMHGNIGLYDREKAIGVRRPCEVGSYREKSGLHDMSGNVAEWCSDYFHVSRFGNRSDNAACFNYPQRKFRLVRGGSFLHPRWNCQSASRDGWHEDFRTKYIGFRIVMISGRVSE